MTHFESVWRKLDHAKNHIDHLEAVIATFLRNNPYKIVIESDGQSTKWIAKIGDGPSSIPAPVPLILGDAIHTIRTALDHFAYAAVPAPSEHTAFPIWRKSPGPEASQLQSLVDGKLSNASKQLRSAVLHLQPHKGGDGEDLWLIDCLDIVDKHRLLLTVGVAYSTFVFEIPTDLDKVDDWPNELPAVPLQHAERYRIKAGTVLLKADPEWFDRQKNLQFVFDVAFGEPEMIVGKPIVPTLRRLLNEVEALLKRLIELV